MDWSSKLTDARPNVGFATVEDSERCVPLINDPQLWHEVAWKVLTDQMSWIFSSSRNSLPPYMSLCPSTLGSPGQDLDISNFMFAIEADSETCTWKEWE